MDQFRVEFLKETLPNFVDQLYLSRSVAKLSSLKKSFTIFLIQLYMSRSVAELQLSEDVPLDVVYQLYLSRSVAELSSLRMSSSTLLIRHTDSTYSIDKFSILSGIKIDLSS